MSFLEHAARRPAEELSSRWQVGTWCRVSHLLRMREALGSIPSLSTAMPNGCNKFVHDQRARLGHHINVRAERAKCMTPAGLEPAIPGSVGRCLIHWATGPCAHPAQRYPFFRKLLSPAAPISQNRSLSLSLSLRLFGETRNEGREIRTPNLLIWSVAPYPRWHFSRP